MSTCLYRPAQVSDHLEGLLDSRPDAILVDNRGQVVAGVLCGSVHPLRLALAPCHRVLGPPAGHSVRIGVQDGDRVTGFYTQVTGVHEGVWALATPRVVRQRAERRASVRVPLGDQQGLVLQVRGGGVVPVVDVSHGGLSFRCDLVAPWARMRVPFRAMLTADGVPPVALRLEIQHLRLDPGDTRTRVAGARVTVLGEAAAWWQDVTSVLACEARGGSAVV